MILKHKDRIREFGGPGSGNWGHLGIPGYHGGSQAGSGGVHARPDNYKEKKGGKKEPKASVKDEESRVKGVEYLRDEFPRSPGYGESHPLVSPEGLNMMQKDLIEAGSKTGIVSATPEQKSALVKQLNNMKPGERNANVNKMSEHYLKLKNKDTDDKSVENQLNKWKLSGKSLIYSPKNG
jgi:hypothetical protein